MRDFLIARPGTFLSALAITGATIFLSMVMYAASTPSPAPTTDQMIHRCAELAVSHIDGHLRIEDHTNILANCVKAYSERAPQ